jgi:hypothetical protein
MLSCLALQKCFFFYVVAYSGNSDSGCNLYLMLISYNWNYCSHRRIVQYKTAYYSFYLPVINLLFLFCIYYFLMISI